MRYRVIVVAAFLMLAAICSPRTCSAQSIPPEEQDRIIAAIKADTHMTQAAKDARIKQFKDSVAASSGFGGIMETIGPMPFISGGIGIVTLIAIIILKKQKEASGDEPIVIKAKGGRAEKPSRADKNKKDKKGATKTPPRPITPGPPEPPPDARPATQEAVEAVPMELRGISFFTSRPLPLTDLVEVTLFIDDQPFTVHASQEEADTIARGTLPLVRAFSLEGKTLPWYDWADYTPYAHYWNAVKSDWIWYGSGIVACWLSLDKLKPDFAGYYSASLEHILPDIPDQPEWGEAHVDDEDEPLTRTEISRHLPKVRTYIREAVIRRRRLQPTSHTLQMSARPLRPGEAVHPTVARLTWSLGTVRRELLEIRRSLAALDEAGEETSETAGERRALKERELESLEFIEIFSGGVPPDEWILKGIYKESGIPLEFTTDPRVMFKLPYLPLDEDEIDSDEPQLDEDLPDEDDAVIAPPVADEPIIAMASEATEPEEAPVAPTARPKRSAHYVPGSVSKPRTTQPEPAGETEEYVVPRRARRVPTPPVVEEEEPIVIAAPAAEDAPAPTTKPRKSRAKSVPQEENAEAIPVDVEAGPDEDAPVAPPKRTRRGKA
ncbi:MAG TPA: hypothetical protein VGK19_18415 [Capsulimonadaceae bacterium]